jgi:hypothetical protein
LLSFRNVEVTGVWWLPWSSKPWTRFNGVWWVRFPSTSANLVRLDFVDIFFAQLPIRFGGLR